MKTFITSVLVALSLAGHSQDKIEDHYKIYDTRTKQIISVDKIMEDCNKADVLFFGEEHNDSAGHYMENIIFQALHK